MQNIILPFRLNNTWFGLELDLIKNVDSCGNISMMPNMQAPLIGLIQKHGTIFPVWSLFHLVGGKSSDVETCLLHIEIKIKDKITIIPVHEVLPVTQKVTGWIPMVKYGLHMFRFLDKKAPQSINDIQEIPVEHIFQYETPISNFQVEELQ